LRCKQREGRRHLGKTQIKFGFSLDLHYLCTQISFIMDTIKKIFAQKLLEVKAVKLQPQEPFTWASGWKSPIYTDNRKTLSFPRLRSFVKLELCHLIQENFPEAEAVAGVATGAIAQGALVAEELGLPFSYVRPKPKDHGMGNQIEGEIEKGAKVVVVEDLISTGGSSLKAVQALRDYGVEVVGMVASFTYGFPVAEEAFREAGVKLLTLSDYEHVVAEAAKTGYIKDEEQPVLAKWRKDPTNWNV
jgi:orotate phosphoribosyltransferase